MDKPKEFWLDVHYEEDGMLHCIEGSDSKRIDTDIHVIEYAAYNQAIYELEKARQDRTKVENELEELKKTLTK